ncbi:MAG: EAL domain-containing protein, partial [Clostridia bacterium]|nr:EAL domain-containing protein [Clostridia bacterium]
YSSLNLLKKLPFDVLKIDKNFFAQEGGTERERLIIANVVNMAKGLGIKVVSEGVETPEQANFLREIQCDMAQGYLYARPMDIKSFEKLYQENTI